MIQGKVKTNRIHFHSLDALRFFAFLQVFLLHIPFKEEYKIFNFLGNTGEVGVAFFFVLSGFLITYLLSLEALQNGKISVSKFLLRRSFRIWPLFFLVVSIVYLLPYSFKETVGLHMFQEGYQLDWRYSFSFLENYKMILEDNFPIATPLQVFWSLCVEEHFYLLWMIVFVFLPIRHLLKFLVCCFGFAWIARIMFHFLTDNVLITEDLFTNLDYFAAGGILGYLVANNFNVVQDFIGQRSNLLKSLILVVAVIFIVFQEHIFSTISSKIIVVLKPSILALIFTCILAIFIPLESKIRIKSKFLNYLGTISYGLYVYHMIVINVLYQYCLNNRISFEKTSNVILFLAVSIITTVLISMVSYHYYEQPFLSLRERLTKTIKEK